MTVAAAATLTFGLGTVAHADEPATPPDSTVPTGVVDGAVVAVDVPPVPPTSIEVAVDVPPVPPTSIEVAVDVPPVPPTSVVVAVDVPPVPPTSVVVAVDVPPVPPVTVPDAVPVVASHAVVAENPSDPDPQQLPETGAAAARATAIVAGAAVSIGAALRVLASRP
jgi:hypothetical protein